MGADQFSPTSKKDQEEAKQFFSFFYWSINLGALVAYTGIAYVCQNGVSTLGGQKWGFFVGYTIPTIVLAVGIAVFVSGYSRYKMVKPQGSALLTFFGILYTSIASKLIGGSVYASPSHASEGAPSALGSEEYALSSQNPSILDVATLKGYSKYQVSSAKYLTKIVPFLLVMIPYWCLYGQTKTAFQLQGCQMNLQIGSLSLPVSSMNIFNNISILVLVPLFERMLYPWLRAQGFKLSMLTKIGVGFFFAIVAMCVAAMVEWARLKNVPPSGNYYDVNARDNITPCKNINNYDPYQYQQWYAGSSSTKPSNCHQTCDTMSTDDTSLLSLNCIQCDDIPQMSNMSILWQIPLFVLIGISEIFASITSLEFFYSQAPSNCRSVSQAANLFTSALGSWLTIPLTLIVNSNINDQWIPADVNVGHLVYYFLLLAGLMLLGLGLFMYLAYGYQYADPEVLAELSRRIEEEESINERRKMREKEEREEREREGMGGVQNTFGYDEVRFAGKASLNDRLLPKTAEI